MATEGASTRTVERALSLLEHVATAERPPLLAEAARASGLALSTASRLLRTLETQGFVRRAGDGRYWPGTRLFQVAAGARRTLPVAELAEEHLRALADATGETAYLGVPDGGDRVIYLRQVESPRAIRHATWLGRTIPVEGTAIGAALHGQVGDDGYALNRGSIEPDSATAAAPVRDGAGEIVAAISVIAPSFRVDDDELNRIGRLVAEHANALSAEAGLA